jgi:hypothetical protein
LAVERTIDECRVVAMNAALARVADSGVRSINQKSRRLHRPLHGFSGTTGVTGHDVD